MLCNPTSQSVAFASSAGSCALICARSKGETPAHAPNKKNETSVCQWLLRSLSKLEQCKAGVLAYAPYCSRSYALATSQNASRWLIVGLSSDNCFPCSFQCSCGSWNGPYTSPSFCTTNTKTSLAHSAFLLTHAPGLIG